MAAGSTHLLKSAFGRVFIGYGYAEGWGHYAEELMWEAGFRKDPETHIGELLNALENTRIDAHRRSKSRAAVDDPMPNRLDLGRAAQLPNQILDRPPEIASLRRVGP